MNFTSLPRGKKEKSICSLNVLCRMRSKIRSSMEFRGFFRPKIFSKSVRTCYYRTIVLRTWRAYSAYLVQQEARHVSRIARESRK